MDSVLRDLSATAKLVTGLAVSYLLYYVFNVVKKPALAAKEGRLKQLLVRTCPSLTRSYWPTPWCWDGRIQTVIANSFKCHLNIKYDEREVLRLDDGGAVVLSWLHGVGDIEKRPIVIILPGITGSDGSNYVQHLVHTVTTLGYRAVVFNYRGRGGIGLLTARTYCACNTEDLCHVIAHIKQRFPDAPLVGIGISLGGLILFHYLAKHERSTCRLLGGMVVSVAWNAIESTKEMHKPLNRLIFNSHIAKGLVRTVQEHLHIFEDMDIVDLDEVMQSTTIRDFDERFTTKIFGYPSLEAYYREATLHDKMHHIDVPLLCLNAADDPFSPAHAIPTADAENNENVVIVVTGRGGHVAFCDHPVWPSGSGYMEKVAADYVKALVEHAHEL